MSCNSPSSGRIRRFFKHVGHGANKLFKRDDQAPTSHPPLPPQVPSADPRPQPTHSDQPIPARLPQLPTQPQQLVVIPQAVPNLGQPAPTISQVANTDDQLADAESSLALAAKKAGADAWSGLKLALQLLEKSSDVFPPIKSAVAGFLGVVDIFQTAAQNRNEYADLALNLQGMVNGFKETPGERTSSMLSEALTAMANGLQKEMGHVEQQQQRSGVKCHIRAEQVAVDVQGCYRRVEALCRELQNKALVEMWRNLEEQKVDARLKELSAALKAMYDSSLSDVLGRRKCTPGTREAVLAGMQKWADDTDGPKVYWLNGMAGTGKTTLAYSFSAEMQINRRLGASFFCSRADADSRDVSRIVPTLAHQLARLLPSYREALIRQIGEDKDIGARNTKAQFEKLIRDPLREVEASVPEGVVVTIDALDECDRRDGARDILNTLLLHARDLPIKFLVTCRPEPGLFAVLESKDERYRSVLHLHDIEASFVQADIRTYLEAELAETSLSLGELGMLASQAGTLFIYAATAVRYIHPQNRRVNVHQRLEDLLSIASNTRTNKHKGIDELYAAVLAAPFADEELDLQERENIRLVLDTTICAKEPINITVMARLLELDDEQDVTQALQHLRSVLHVSRETNLISTLHASFPDFMFDLERSNDLCCNAANHNRLLALRCFSIMKHFLKFNICELESSFVLDENIPSLAEKFDKAISPELFYACRYWGAHLVLAEAPTEVHSALEAFLSHRLLFWMEVLNLRCRISAGAQLLTHVFAWLQKLGGSSDVRELALDASRFVTAFSLSSASRSTPHIYISALPFWPETRPVGLWYQKRMQGSIRLEGTGMKGRDLSCLAVWNTGSAVTCLAYSPDGSRIVSSSANHTVRVWGAYSGELVAGPLEGHSRSVYSVAFSPDGTRITSCSNNSTICIWDAHSGLLTAGPLKEHTRRVHCVAFSPGGTHIVSGSDDRTIRVWDAQSGLLVAGPFEGHTSTVRSVAFSPESARIVSGFADGTIRVWDARSGLLISGSFKGHTDSVRSVAFSPDDTRIASGSNDKNVCVWDAYSGDLVAGPFEGHTGTVRSVAFSPGGTCVVSGSDDHTIRVWNAHSGDLVAGPLEGHTNTVSFVSFSPDGTCIVSGSTDWTIRVWDTRCGLLVAGQFPGHTNLIKSVAFSPDGTRIVSGSWDRTICVWDARSGFLVAGPFEGHVKPVNSVAFSPDGARIASGSWDKTICVWDAYSGLLVAGPFTGHTDSVNSVTFSPNGTRIASGSADNTICVWDSQSGLLVAGPFEGHTKSVNSVAYSPDGTRIVSGSADRTTRIWGAHSGNLAAGPFEGHTKLVHSVAFSPDGARIVSGSDDRTICIWDTHSGLLVAGPLRGHTNTVNSVAFSPDGARIVSGSGDHTIHIWDSYSGLLIAAPFMGHTGPVRSVLFSPDGTYIASSSTDRTIRVWATTPLHAHNPERLKDWQMDKTGMITTQQGLLLLCVPVDLWTRVVPPQNLVCIHARGILRFDFENVLLGNEWVKCYQSL